MFWMSFVLCMARELVTPHSYIFSHVFQNVEVQAASAGTRRHCFVFLLVEPSQ